MEDGPAPHTRRRVVEFKHGGRRYAIRVWETGPPSGPVVVVNAGTITMAAPLMRALGRTVRVVAYEHAGLGPDAGPIIAADYRDAAGAKPVDRFNALEAASKSFMRSFQSKHMIDPMMVRTSDTEKASGLVRAMHAVLDEIDKVVTNGEHIKARVTGSKSGSKSPEQGSTAGSSDSPNGASSDPKHKQNSKE